MSRTKGSVAGWNVAKATAELLAMEAGRPVPTKGKPLSKRRNSRQSRAHRLEAGLTPDWGKKLNVSPHMPMEDVARAHHTLRLHCTVLELVADAIQRDLSPEEAATILRDAAAEMRQYL